MLRKLVALLPLLLVAASTVMLVFINISGSTTSLTFVNRFYFSKITSPYDRRWTMYAMCAEVDGVFECTLKKAAYPFEPAAQLATVPEEFVTHKKTYYYLLRIAYAMYLLALVAAVLTFLPLLFAFCLPGFLTGIFASWWVFIAMFFTSLGSAFNTAAHVKGVKSFNAAGFEALLGVPMFVCMWLSVAFLLITYIWMMYIGVHGLERDIAHLRGYSDSDLESSMKG